MKAVAAMKTGLSLHNKNTEPLWAPRDAGLSHEPATKNRSSSTAGRRASAESFPPEIVA